MDVETQLRNVVCNPPLVKLLCGTRRTTPNILANTGIQSTVVLTPDYAPTMIWYWSEQAVTECSEQSINDQSE
jgi:hypothetical protein